MGYTRLRAYPKTSLTRIGNACLAVDYPTSDQYKLVTIGLLGGKEGYKFQVFSSEGSDGMWHKFQLRMDLSNTFSNFLSRNPVYVNDSVHWLRNDGRVVAFNTKREEATTLDLPEFINHHDCRHVKEVRHLYEYDSEMNRLKIAAVLDKDDRVILYCLPSFTPTLASVHKTLFSHSGPETSVSYYCNII
ncbi:hypothetical protein A4A49_51353 [Nicotiana attenuata]|uniref:F-box protein n=1 Tax=Nicotiana attenuata TaxID=49451 RepID=A0A1J6KJV7_NICAT|nr:hypothetical protein A4A49_51353 [Nicotiana attenuata]